MPEPSNTFRTKRKAFAALSLAFAAGCVDIIGYISFGHLFTAHLTGETVHLGQGLLDARWDQAARAGAIIAAFFVGSIVGRSVIEIGARYRIRNVATAGLILEATLIAIVAVSTRNWLLPVVLLASAMGVQTAILTRVGSLTVHTTFVTGMLNKLAQLLSHACFLTYDVFRGSRNGRSMRFSILLEARLIFAVWACYLIGAAAGTGTRSLWGLHALLVPTAVVCMVAMADLIAPLAIEEERDVSER
jgi:uncharacterized membrane protein YoaK (UPF0700 family)